MLMNKYDLNEVNKVEFLCIKHQSMLNHMPHKKKTKSKPKRLAE